METISVDAAIRRAARFLEASQRPDGRWLDFRGETFISSQWVTAYVGSHLWRASGEPAAPSRALTWLLGHQHPGGGWGFSLANPPDADSIANVVHLLAALGGPEEALGFATELLLRYWADEGGGFRTYLPIPGDPLHFPGSAWCDVHLSVTAMAAQALHAVDEGRHREVLSACARLLRARQAEAGFWDDYWWDGRTYATYHACRFLSLAGDQESTARAGDWLMEVRSPGGGWGNGVNGEPAPLHTAFAVGTLLLGDPRRHADGIREGIRWLLDAQIADGSFAAVPTQRVPRPSVHAPWEGGEDTLLRPLLTDHNRLFTTATVLAVLGDSRGASAAPRAFPVHAAKPDAPIDLFTPALRANPEALFARLRTEEPVSRVTVRGRPCWLITRYDDAVAALKDPRLVKSPPSASEKDAPRPADPSSDVLRVMTGSLLDLDPPDHTRLRSIVQRSLTPALLDRLRARAQALADELLDAGLARGEMDIMTGYAYPLSAGMITDMLGAPVRDRGMLEDWAKAFDKETSAGALGGAPRRVPILSAFAKYTREMITDRRAHPASDLVSALMRAEDDGTALDEAALLSTTFLLLIAGYNTTASLIGNGVLSLLDHPEQMARLREDPSLARAAIEEILRYKGPAKMATMRFAREDVDIGGQVIPKGEMVGVVLWSSNHDPARFRDPEAFDLGREDQRHLGFGFGIHYCVGAPLARLEGQIAITTLLRRAPRLRLSMDRRALVWREDLLVASLKELWVAF